MVIEFINNVIYFIQFMIVALLCFQMVHRITIKKIILVGITLFAITVMQFFIKNIEIRMPITFIYMFYIMCLLYHEKKSFLLLYTLAMTAGLSLLNLMPEMMVTSIMSMVTDTTDNGDVYSTYSLMITTLFLFGIGVITYKNFNKGFKLLSWKYMIVFSIVVVMDSVVVLALGDFALNTFEKNKLYKIMYVFVVIGIFVQIAMVIWFMLSREVYREKDLLTQKYLNMQVEHYSYLENKERETKKFRHDIRHHMNMLAMLYGQQDHEPFGKYMEQINGRIDQFGNKINVGNGIADAILNKYYVEAEEKGVILRVEGCFPEKCVISAYDLCTILSNLLSNAICAEEEYGGTEVFVGCRYTDSEIMLEMKNHYTMLVKDEKGKMITRKLDDTNHGFGLENVIECVERNHGYMDIKTNDGIFRVLLSLKNETMN